MTQPARDFDANVDETLMQEELVISTVDRWFREDFSGATTEVKLRVAEAVILDTVVRDTGVCELAQTFFYRHRFGADLLEALQSRYEGNIGLDERERRLFVCLAKRLHLRQFFAEVRWLTIQNTADVFFIHLGFFGR